MSAKIDLVGQRFGKLLVLEDTELRTPKRKQIIWKCLCDCGNTTTVVAYSLRHGITRSCGCLRLDHVKRMGAGHQLPPGEAAENATILLHKKKAKGYGQEWSLSREECIELMKGNCYYCGGVPEQVKRSALYEIKCNGIDRVDNNKGYTTDNCVSCCFVCNRAKNTMTVEEFMTWIKRITNYQRERA